MAQMFIMDFIMESPLGFEQPLPHAVIRHSLQHRVPAVRRNKEHYQMMFEAFGEKFSFNTYVRTTGVSCVQNANTDPTRPYTRCAMRSGDETACSRDWKANDGGDWW